MAQSLASLAGQLVEGMPVSAFHTLRLQVNCNAHLALYVGFKDPNMSSALLVECVLKAKTAPAS